MQQGLDIVLVIIMLLCLNLLGSSRIRNCIRLAAYQGLLLGFLPLLAPWATHTPWSIGYAAVSVVLRGVVFPWVLIRAVRQSAVQREVEPYVGFSSSLIFGGASLILCAWLSTKLPLPEAAPSAVALPVALFTGLTGLFLTVSRKKAINQVLGYLVLENGISIFGVLLVRHQPLLVELGVLLDLFAALFVMGITMFHINREFDHMDADRLASLKD